MSLPKDQGMLLLKKQLMERNDPILPTELQKKPVDGFSAGLIDDDNYYIWEVVISGPVGSYYEGGYFKAHLTFPEEYPQRPPKLKFISEMWHPNVGKDGFVSISILHEPGDDKLGYERAEERWLPIHTVENIMLCVISMISEPNDASPANADAAKQFMEDYESEFKKQVQRCVRLSQAKL